MAPAITIMQLAQHRLGPEYDGHALTGAEFQKVGLPIVGGCEVCHATVAAFNSCPSKTGYIRCRDCIEDLGYPTAEEADAAIFGEEAVSHA